MSRWWLPGEMWIPYDPEHQAPQERFMNNLLKSGQFIYKDATRITCPGESPRYFWILTRPPKSEVMRNARKPVLPVEKVERARNYRATNGLEASLGGGVSVGSGESLCSRFDTHEPPLKPGQFCVPREIHTACKDCAKECKVYDAPNSSFTCFEKVSKKALLGKQNEV